MEEYTLRPAGPADIPILVEHRKCMFRDMAALKGESHSEEALEVMGAAFGAFIGAHFTDGSLSAWIFEKDGQPVASGELLIVPWLPSPRDPVGRVPYVHNIYTLPEHRRRGLARRIMEVIIAHCREAGFTLVKLHASQEGRPLYESLGFTANNEMRLNL